MTTDIIHNWMDLARSNSKTKRATAYDLATEYKALLQDELLVWFGVQSNFKIKTKLFLLLDEIYQEKAIRLSGEEQLSVFPNIRINFKLNGINGDELKSWLSLATSHEPENRMLAFYMAEGMPQNFQYPLKKWFSENTNFKIKQELYALLNAEYQTKVDNEGAKSFAKFPPQERLAFFKFVSDGILKEAALKIIFENKRPEGSMILLVKHYKSTTHKGLKESYDFVQKNIEQFKKYLYQSKNSKIL